MKTAFISQFFKEKEKMNFGPYPLIHNIIKGVSEKHETVVFANRHAGSKKEEIINQIKIKRSLPIGLGIGKFPYFAMAFAVKSIKKEKPNVINSQDFAGVLAFKRLEGAKIPRITSVKSLMRAREKTFNEKELTLRDKWVIKTQKLIETKCVENSDWLITQSNYAKKELKEIMNVSEEKIKLIYNGIDTGKFKKIKELPKEPTILFGGGTNKRIKRADVFFKSLEQVKKEIPKLKVKVIGAENITEYWVSLKKAGFKKNEIKCQKKIDNNKMPQLINECSILMHPSDYETFGTLIGESMACERPVIASNCAAMPEVLGGSGILAEKGNIDAFAENSISLLSNRKKMRELGKKARQRVLENYTLKKTVSEYIKFLEKEGKND